MFYFVDLMKLKNKLSNYTTFTLKHFIHFTGHFSLFYSAKSIILLNMLYLKINFLNTDHFIKNT
jgi:hypothetical protein